MGSQSGSEDEGTDFAALVTQFANVAQKEQKTKQKKELAAAKRLVGDRTSQWSKAVQEMEQELKQIGIDSFKDRVEIDRTITDATRDLTKDYVTVINTFADARTAYSNQVAQAREERLTSGVHNMQVVPMRLLYTAKKF